MSEPPRPPSGAHPSEPPASHDPVEATRMSFGDHLEELRRCLIRALLGIVLAGGIALYFGKDILDIVLRPLFLAQLRHGQPPGVMALSPPESFTVYIKIALLCGFILSMPWVLYQLWVFVSAGLYRHEQRFVKLLLPTSAVLFALGVAFLYWVVLPISLDFFITFSPAVSIPELRPAAPDADAAPSPTSRPAGPGSTLPVYDSDPPDAREGEAWINARAGELRVMTPEGVRAAPLEKVQPPAAVSGQFALQYYVSFVLSLALGFGLAFETPLLVVFLCVTGLVPAQTMARVRRYIVFGIVVAAAVITPPDVLSMILLSLPMILLFELGLLAARALDRRKGSESGV